MIEWIPTPFEHLLSEPVRNGIYKKKEFHGRGAKIVNMGELFAHPRLHAIPMKRVTLSDSESKRFLLAEGDLLFARRSLTAEGAGKCSIVMSIDEATTFESSIIRARPDITRANSLFLYYFFSSGLGANLLDSIKRQVAVAGITGGDLAKVSIPTPPISTQRNIASILSSLDERIELNRQTTETLEALAQALFRDWFVDYGPVRRKFAGITDAVEIMGGLVSDPARAEELAQLFPEALGEDDIPQRWQRMELSLLAEQCKGTVDPQGAPETLFEHYSLPAYDAGHEPACDLGFSIKSNKVPVPVGTVLISKLNPEIRRVWVPNDHSGLQQIASTEFLVLKPRAGSGRGLLYFMFRDPTVRQIMEGMVTGTSRSHQRISPPALLQTAMIVGHPIVFSAFEEFADLILKRVLALRLENRTLAATRDYLLPRLMSGEVRVRARDVESAT